MSDSLENSALSILEEGEPSFVSQSFLQYRQSLIRLIHQECYCIFLLLRYAHLVHLVGLPLELPLDGAIGSVLHPASQPQLSGLGVSVLHHVVVRRIAQNVQHPHY